MAHCLLFSFRQFIADRFQLLLLVFWVTQRVTKSKWCPRGPKRVRARTRKGVSKVLMGKKGQHKWRTHYAFNESARTTRRQTHTHSRFPHTHRPKRVRGALPETMPRFIWWSVNCLDWQRREPFPLAATPSRSHNSSSSRCCHSNCSTDWRANPAPRKLNRAEPKRTELTLYVCRLSTTHCSTASRLTGTVTFCSSSPNLGRSAREEEEEDLIEYRT